MFSETMVPLAAAGDLLARLADECREADARLMGLARQCRDLAPHLPPGALDRGTAASLALAGKWARDAAESLAEALARLARRQPEGQA